MQEALEHDLCADELRQVVARLASLFALALELANLKAPADEIAKVDATHQHLASSQARSRSRPCSAAWLSNRSASIRVMLQESGSSSPKLRSPSRPFPAWPTADSTECGGSPWTAAR